MRPASWLRLIGGGFAAGLQLALAACQAGGGEPAATEGVMHSPDTQMAFALTSPEFGEGQSIPRRFACDGDDVSPPLTWSGAPGDAAALALVMDDPDANGFVHWVVLDMTASAIGSLPAGWSKSPDAPPQGTNSFGRVGYGGPCPPSGTHRYAFRLLALDQVLGLTGAPRAQEVLAAGDGHIIAEAKLTGTYRKGG
jgi:Raf kinase inhibitor-like YbhB/YbcL family protein